MRAQLYTGQKKYIKNCVALGYPGETTEEKMKNSIFTLTPSLRSAGGQDSESAPSRPPVVKEAFQVFECTWDDSYPRKVDEALTEDHFLLRIDRIVMKKMAGQALQGKGIPSHAH